jgi:FMN-dependent oxidoreductase (nitrilotriacetate monooxygenase family)
MADRQLHLGAFLRPVSIHTAWWRYPTSAPDANISFRHLKYFAQKLEHGKFDFFFMADHLAVLNVPPAALQRSATVTSFDPLVLLPALAAVTERLGLVATASTTYNDPYHVARKFAALDHISGGRAGWNVVTSANPDEAKNFGLEEHMEHDLRYERAREFHEIVTKLWDSWADDAFVRDKDSGIYSDLSRMHVPDHQGRWFKVRGPLNIGRPVQGWPVIVQAGQSPAGRQFAADRAEAIFGASNSMADAQSYYKDVKARARAAGRDPDHVKVMPGCFVIVADTVAEARRRKALLDSLVHPDSGMGTLSMLLGTDASKFELDAPLPEIPETNAGRTGRQKLVELSARDGLTVRQLAQLVGGSFGALEMVGTAQTVADEMQQWLESGACDGFNILFPYLPEGLDDVVDRLVPELQRRGLFRREYAGTTLREHLGLPRPKNRYFDR